ncbi:MAG: helix-turn-helix transcriptional regulator [Candidatus Tectomicrobia bacterium]|nr:helix-turn-helix transcriptional regulator [Candidatus Tectomicrobia bacterium]
MRTAAVNRMFRAFTDPIRLRILLLLREDEMCVGDLVEVLQVPQPTASRHLRYLREAGLVEVRKDGRWCFYSLTEARTSFHAKLLDCLGSCFQEAPELEGDQARAKRLRMTGGCCPPGCEETSR